MSDGQDTNTEIPEIADTLEPGEPVTEPEIEVEPPTRGLVPYAIVGGVLIAIVALVAVLVGSDLTGIVDDGDADIAVEKLVEDTTSAPTVIDDSEGDPSVIRLAGIDASKCDLSQIEVKNGVLGIDRDCLKLVFEDVPQVLTLPSP